MYLKQKLTITLTKVQRQTVQVPLLVARLRCPVCQREADMLTTRQAEMVLEIEPQTLVKLMHSGQVHAVQTINGNLLVCKNSLALEAPSSPTS